ncbi:MAG: response regulator [Spirochaetia bacterium]|nr:response regulator [Spirochaetia bacterium]
MKILIIDDEMMIKEWLRFTISSLPYEIDLVAAASNGEEALKKMDEDHFDLIFVDVMMPKMNGLEFLKRINETGTDAMLVVLSSHDEFKFAKEAITYNVKEYVLKNECSKEKLSELIQECQDQIANRSSDGSMTEEQLERVLHGTIPPKAVQIISKRFRTLSGTDCFVAAVDREVPQLPQLHESGDVKIVREGLIGSTEKNSFYLFSMSSAAPDRDLSIAKLDFARVLSQETGSRVSLGKTVLRLEEILPECRNSWIGYQRLFFSTVTSCSGPNRYREFDTEQVDSFCDITLSNIRSYAKEKTIEQLKEINAYFRKTQPTDIDAVINIYMALLSTFIIYTNKKSRRVTEKLEALRSAINSFRTFEQLSVWIVQTIESNAELIERNRFAPAVEHALEYIEEHYTDIRSVTQIADHVNLSLDYFSRFFKKQVGVTLNSYLINYRLDKASIILLSSNLSVQEVAKKVGIENGSYFSKCFKKKFHTQPIQFRIHTS